jgi:hypothetical protein
VAHTCNPSTQKAKAGRLGIEDSLGNIARPCIKKSKARAGRVTQVIQHLPSKREGKNKKKNQTNKQHPPNPIPINNIKPSHMNAESMYL